MRLIDADALGIGKAKREAFTVPEYADGWNAAIEIIDAAPTVDRPTRSQFKRMAAQLGYEKVTHCRDCKRFSQYPVPELYIDVDGFEGWCNNNGFRTNKLDFCSRAERKDNEK